MPLAGAARADPREAEERTRDSVEAFDGNGPDPPLRAYAMAAALSALLLAGSLALTAAGRAAPARVAVPDANPGSRTLDETPCAGPEHRRFDFWIGEWDVSNRQLNPARPEDETLYETGTATSRVYAVLDGCAVVEHWEGRLVPDRHVLGFSVRAWDPDRNAWVALLNWPGARGASFLTMEGTVAGSVGTFSSRTATGRRVRYRFRDMGGGRVRWTGSRRSPEATEWTTFWVMDFSRREPTRDPALFNGPARTTRRCPGERARAYDFLVGDWIGETAGDASGPSRAITLRAWPILGGCAVMEFLTLGEGDTARRKFRIRSFVAGEDRWVQYTVRQASPVLVRWEASPADDHALSRVTDLPDEPATRAVYGEIGSDSFVREIRVRSEGDWRTVARTRFRRR